MLISMNEKTSTVSLDTYLELCGGIEFRLNGVQLHPEVLFIHLDSITTFSLNLLFDQDLAGEK